MSKTKNLVFTSLLIAMGVALPLAFHAVPNAGSIFLPMHIPVLLCGLICGWHYGFVCGVLTPALSSVLTGMPPAAYLPSMLFELAVYGLVGGLLLKYVRTRNGLADTIISLLGAMVAGRAVAGALKALIFNVGEYSMQMWITSSFVTALPGIVIQIVAIPAVIQILRSSKLIPRNRAVTSA